MNTLFEPLIESMTPLNHGPHAFPLTLEREMTPETLLSSHCHAYVLKLLLDHLLRLRMEKGIYLELKIFLLLSLFLTFTHHLIVSALHQCEVGVPIEKVIFLQKDCIGLLFIFGEVANGLNVAVFEVLLLQLCKNHILLTKLSVADHKHFKVLLNLIRRLGLNLSCNRVNISKVMLPYPLDKSLILFDSPLEEPSLSQFTEPLLVLLRHDLIVILCNLYLLAKRLKLLEVVIELELIHFGYLDCAVLPGHRLFLALTFPLL
jgi:hypothetical protein